MNDTLTVNDAITRDWLANRFSRRPDDSPGVIDTRNMRGDHSLNPGMDVAEDLRQAAVLVPLVNQPDGITILLTKRTDHLAHHPGQISFPGGHIEPEDDTPEITAIRETEEETGIPAHHIELIGRLDTYITRTGFDITPIVGVLEPNFTLEPDPHEVAEVFEVPLSFFLDPGNHQRHSRLHEGETRHFYAMPYNDHFIWGATAGMLVNLYEFLVRP